MGAMVIVLLGSLLLLLLLGTVASFAPTATAIIARHNVRGRYASTSVSYNHPPSWIIRASSGKAQIPAQEDEHPGPILSQEPRARTANVTAYHAARYPENSVADTDMEAPSTNKILSIAIPAIGIWLCGPLLSMIDTSTVGLLSGTIQQAALNPAVAATEYTSRLLSFLYAGTTNLVAMSQKEDQGVQGMPKTAKVFANSIQLSVLVGTGLGLTLLLTQGYLLRLLIGTSEALDPRIFEAASKYVGIRALGMPAAALIGTAQAACLGLQDSKSALMVFGVASVINLVVDLVLVRNPHPWIGGVAGAAWATVLAQYFAAWLFVRWLCSPTNVVGAATQGDTAPDLGVKGIRKLLKRKNTPTEQQSTFAPPSSSKAKRTKLSTKGFLAGRFEFRQLMKRPASDMTRGFAPFVVPVTTSTVGRCSSYAAMGHVVSSVLGTTSMAANQIILSIFYTLIPIADSLSLTAQSLIPGIVAKREEDDVGTTTSEQSTSTKAGAISRQSKPSTRTPRSKVLWQTTLNFSKAAGMMGLLQASIVAIIPLLGRLFTKDAAVIQMVNSVVPILLVVFASHGIFCGAEGILLGQRDLTFLGRMYGLYFLVVPFLMLRLKWAALAGTATINLLSVWKVFLGYQIFRISAWVGRVLWLQYKLHQSESENSCGTNNSSIAG